MATAQNRNGATIELELKASGATEQEWLKALIEAQADFARDVMCSYTEAARSFLK